MVRIRSQTPPAERVVSDSAINLLDDYIVIPSAIGSVNTDIEAHIRGQEARFHAAMLASKFAFGVTTSPCNGQNLFKG